MRLYSGAGNDTGDDGFTYHSQIGKAPKSDEVFELLGTVDELIAHLGLLQVENAYLPELRQSLSNIHDYIEGSAKSFDDASVTAIENEITGLQATYPRHGEYRLLQSTRVAQVELARAVARRLERRLYNAAIAEEYPQALRKYINRVSDYLEALGHYLEFSETISGIVKNVLEANETICSKPTKMTLAEAKRIIEIAEAEATDMQMAAVIAVCGAEGNAVAMHAMDNSFLISGEVAVNKAYTAVALKMTTEELAGHVQTGGMFYGLKGERICPIAGGAPLYNGRRLIGGIGVSGGTAEQDKALLKRVLIATKYS